MTSGHGPNGLLLHSFCFSMLSKFQNKKAYQRSAKLQNYKIVLFFHNLWLRQLSILLVAYIYFPILSFINSLLSFYISPNELFIMHNSKHTFFQFTVKQWCLLFFFFFCVCVHCSHTRLFMNSIKLSFHYILFHE